MKALYQISATLGSFALLSLVPEKPPLPIQGEKVKGPPLF